MASRSPKKEQIESAAHPHNKCSTNAFERLTLCQMLFGRALFRMGEFPQAIYTYYKRLWKVGSTAFPVSCSSPRLQLMQLLTASGFVPWSAADLLPSFCLAGGKQVNGSRFLLGLWSNVLKRRSFCPGASSKWHQEAQKRADRERTRNAQNGIGNGHGGFLSNGRVPSSYIPLAYSWCRNGGNPSSWWVPFEWESSLKLYTHITNAFERLAAQPSLWVVLPLAYSWCSF